ncbi:flagellar biosynthesis protein FlhB [Rhizobiaceae bacterium BDR2-2]|uniref:Flagellar biosynthetic protein FlhB n=1 Tax=Ectorhizobium quercum TaxID=2965071 RepID=A0AAE3MZM6_9HYPH|nr:flagellar biosynthesis protein FlhB [Ectorhizobium quercum]MCX8996092.1 flagellar biosynthesis protein FlhB [Ectorhizobium quercum]
MSDEDKDSKTEDPTEKKLSDAAEKGNTPSSREVSVFATALAFYIYLVFFLPDNMARLSQSLKDIFEHPEQWRLNSSQDLISLFFHVAKEGAMFLLPVAVMFIMFSFTASAAQNVPSFVLERIRPQLSRISPLSGFKRIYSIQGMVEFGKSIFKIIVVAIIMYFVLRNDYYRALDAMFSEPETIFARLSAVIAKAMIVLLFATGALAIVDLFWTRHKWFTDLKMSKQEIKDEMKQSQGDPIVKARQRSVARDRARRRMIDAVPRATLVITNPTHYAVALRYEKDENEAPVVVAKGQDLIALRIREIAEKNHIPIFEDPPLARSMFAQVSVDSVIPSVFYKAVAELIHRVYAASPQSKRVT